MTTTFPFPVQAAAARRQLRLAVVAALKAAALSVGQTAVRIDSPGNWPYPQQNLPALCVRTGAENKASIGKSAPNFTTGVELEVRAAVAATTAEAAQDAIEELWRQIENAILTDFYVLQLVQQVAAVESGTEVKADGQMQIAGVIARFRLETQETFDISQVPAAATAPSVATPITPLETVTVDWTREESDPPFSAQPDDVGLTLNFTGD